MPKTMYGYMLPGPWFGINLLQALTRGFGKRGMILIDNISSKL
jgi:hypothetical protein